MPFGAQNAGAVYSRFVEMCIQRLRNNSILAYIDDVLIHTMSLTQHVDELEKVLEVHRAAGIKLRPHKTNLFHSSAEYLGYRVSKDGINMQDDYVRRILEWPAPTTVKQLNTWLGFIGYYRSFI